MTTLRLWPQSKDHNNIITTIKQIPHSNNHHNQTMTRQRAYWRQRQLNVRVLQSRSHMWDHIYIYELLKSKSSKEPTRITILIFRSYPTILHTHQNKKNFKSTKSTKTHHNIQGSHNCTIIITFGLDHSQDQESHSFLIFNFNLNHS